MNSDPATKVVYLARRNPSLSIADFPARWRQHSLLAGSMPSIRPGFAQVAQCINLYDRAVVPRAALNYDGVNLLTLSGPEFATLMWQSDEVQELILPDELATFASYVRYFSLTTLEYPVSDSPMRPFCLISFLKRDRKLGMEEFKTALIDAHAEMARGKRRAVVNIVTDRQPGYNFDAITELWFESEADAIETTQCTSYVNAYLPRRLEICDEWRTVVMMTRINYARPAIA
jgi:hypothetical protein